MRREVEVVWELEGAENVVNDVLRNTIESVLNRNQFNKLRWLEIKYNERKLEMEQNDNQW